MKERLQENVGRRKPKEIRIGLQILGVRDILVEGQIIDM
jgi:hypothetical protein